MQPKNPEYQRAVREVFEQAAFVTDLGIELIEVGPGTCEAALPIDPKHLQQDAYVHAGVQATLADHTAGGAAGSLVGANEMVLTVEFKINLLRPACGERLRCRATVLKPGRRLIVAEAEVYAVVGDGETLVSKAMVTLAVLAQSE